MKKCVFFLFFIISYHGMTQVLSTDYYVIVPNTFDFVKEKNKYRLNELTYFLFNKYGFKAIMSDDDLPLEVAMDKCKALKSDVLDKSGLLTTRLVIILKDCSGTIVFESQEGKSKEKDYKKAYTEALRKAFHSVEALHHHHEQRIAKQHDFYNPGGKDYDPTASHAMSLYAKPILHGYQLLDASSKTVFKMYYTDLPEYYMAIRIQDNVQGVIYNFDNQWYFKFYFDNKEETEKILIIY